MSEDRTQAPSKRRRQAARERGQAAFSPDLNAAAGLLAASIVLLATGDRLSMALLDALRTTPTEIELVADAPTIVAHARSLALGMAAPLLAALAGFALGAIAAHQAQVRGLWAPALLAPDLARLWLPARGGIGLAHLLGRGIWSLARALVVAMVAFLVIRHEWPRLQQASMLSSVAMIRTAGVVLRDMAAALAGATLALGVLDFVIQYRRFETMLQVTPEEHREDLRATEGDPSLRARRRRVVQAWRAGSAETLAGASLLLTGPRGLTVVLVGGPPPRHVSIRAIVSGTVGEPLRATALERKIPILDAPDLALRLARRRPPSLPPTREILDILARLWPYTPARSKAP